MGPALAPPAGDSPPWRTHEAPAHELGPRRTNGQLCNALRGGYSRTVGGGWLRLWALSLTPEQNREMRRGRADPQARVPGGEAGVQQEGGRLLAGESVCGSPARRARAAF